MRQILFILPIALLMLLPAVLLLVLVCRALLAYIRSKKIREEKNAVKRSLEETLREHRTQRQMTQEFVAESIGVSRQAVSKWEKGLSDPSTSNLLALARRWNRSANAPPGPEVPAARFRSLQRLEPGRPAGVQPPVQPAAGQQQEQAADAQGPQLPQRTRQ